MRKRSSLWIAGSTAMVGASLALSALLVGCDQFVLYSAFSPPPLSISPAVAQAVVSGTVDFHAAGGVPPYAYSVVAGGGTVGAATGLYSAPGAPGTAAVAVTDADGTTRVASITISWPPTTALSISPAVAAVEVRHTVSFAAAGGIPPYAYSLAAGGGSISAAGIYTAPSAAGSAAVTVRDAAGSSSVASVTVVAASPLAISPGTLTLGVGATYQFSAAGGVSPYTFSLYSGTGTVSGSGLYTAPGSVPSNPDTVRVTDAAGSTADASVQVVAGGSVNVSPSSPTVSEGGTVTFVGSGGTAPYTYSLSPATGAGSIGATTGVYTAPVAAVGTIATVTVTVTDSGTPASVSTQVTVVPSAPANLTATTPKNKQIQLTWTNTTTVATSIVILRQTGGSGSFTPIATVSATATSYLDLSVSPNTLYTYEIYAQDGTLDSPDSGQAFSIS